MLAGTTRMHSYLVVSRRGRAGTWGRTDGAGAAMATWGRHRRRVGLSLGGQRRTDGRVQGLQDTDHSLYFTHNR